MACFESGELTEREIQERAFAEKHDGLLVQVKGLQALVAERRNRIMQLEAQLEELKRNPASSANEKKAYKKGWQACADELKSITQAAARSLRAIDEQAFKLFLEGEKK
jgi:lysozyme family protein